MLQLQFKVNPRSVHCREVTSYCLYSGDGGHPQTTSNSIRHEYTNALEYYEYAEGGGSYGHAASPRDLRAPIRGGGAHYAGGNWNGASGYVKISYTRMYSD